MICTFHNKLRSNILSRFSATLDNLVVKEGTKSTEHGHAYTLSNGDENLDDEITKIKVESNCLEQHLAVKIKKKSL